MILRNLNVKNCKHMYRIEQKKKKKDEALNNDKKFSLTKNIKLDLIYLRISFLKNINFFF